MATYKVIQDIEAEDKLVGPLTLRQFIYAAIAAVSLYACFLGITKHLAFIILPIFVPVALMSGFFAFPWTGEQPTEIWALAKIRFMIKPRRRIWNQSGIKDLVTVTAPKQVERSYSNGLSQTEVKSRLKALADTIDSRGWVVKNIDVNPYRQPAFLSSDNSDRLIGVDNFVQEVPQVDIRASDDMLDEQNSPVAQQFNSMIAESEQAKRQKVIQEMNQVDSSANEISVPQQNQSLSPSYDASKQQFPPNNYWFLSQQPAMGTSAQVISPETPGSMITPAEPTAADRELLQQLQKQSNPQPAPYYHLHTIQPLSVQRKIAEQEAKERAEQAKKTISAAPAMTAKSDPAILAWESQKANLASNNDLSVATIARQARQQNPEPPDEVVISLHGGQ